ncbi:MAG: hypothetical protein CMB25_06475 [Euryarchaeota archaeon]|nr:hypothetical protein [Euryarchaeota archaeon]|tara:strand:+ start:2465 stop:2737 length:273 start_codon:yes stop_codon:yes gene_type:complete
MSDGFAMELCGNQASWQIVPDGVTSIDLDLVGERIIESGYEVGVQSRMVWTFTGPADLTLYPSGKLLVKTSDKELAEKIATEHITVWTHE